MKKIFFLNIFIVAIILILLEFLARIFGLAELQGYNKNSFYQENNVALHRPNFSSIVMGKKLITDENGFRIPSKNYKYKNLENILILGDSVSFGVSVDERETFVGKLRKETNRNLFNASVSGHTLTSYNYLIKKYENETTINKVLIFLCLNDIVLAEGIIKKKDIKFIRPDDNNIFIKFLKNDFFLDINFFLREKSVLFNVLKAIGTNNVERWFRDIEPYYQKIDYINEYKKNIKEIIEFSKSKKTHVSFVLLPYKYQIIRDCHPDLMRPQYEIQNIFKELNYELFDLSEEFCDKNEKELFLNFDPMHLSPKGHDFVSKLLLKKQLINNK
mgnify:CR=1 FL=1